MWDSNKPCGALSKCCIALSRISFPEFTEEEKKQEED